jgi:hypothetical protein
MFPHKLNTPVIAAKEISRPQWGKEDLVISPGSEGYVAEIGGGKSGLARIEWNDYTSYAWVVSHEVDAM